MFSPISLAEMDKVKLMKRTDTKFVVDTGCIPTLLQSIAQHYRILEINNNRLMTYDSKYFDTEALSFYFDHHNKMANRIKIRKRNYVESGITFFEIKRKDNKGVTRKSRVAIDNFNDEVSEKSNAFIEAVTQKHLDVSHTLSNRFNRITLVSLADEERVTMDFNLSYNGEIYNEHLAIIELKQKKLNRDSQIFKALKKLHINPFSISKYCIGMASTNPNLKQNYFKQKILTINKLTA